MLKFFRNHLNSKSVFHTKKISFFPHNLKFTTSAQVDKEPDFLQMVKTYFDESSKYIQIPSECLDLIKTCKAVIRFNFPLIRDDGSI